MVRVGDILICVIGINNLFADGMFLRGMGIEVSLQSGRVQIQIFFCFGYDFGSAARRLGPQPCQRPLAKFPSLSKSTILIFLLLGVWGRDVATWDIPAFN